MLSCCGKFPGSERPLPGIDKKRLKNKKEKKCLEQISKNCLMQVHTSAI